MGITKIVLASADNQFAKWLVRFNSYFQSFVKKYRKLWLAALSLTECPLRNALTEWLLHWPLGGTVRSELGVLGEMMYFYNVPVWRRLGNNFQPRSGRTQKTKAITLKSIAQSFGAAWTALSLGYWASVSQLFAKPRPQNAAAVWLTPFARRRRPSVGRCARGDWPEPAKAVQSERRAAADRPPSLSRPGNLIAEMDQPETRRDWNLCWMKGPMHLAALTPRRARATPS